MTLPVRATSVRTASQGDGSAIAELREQWRLESHQTALGSDATFSARFLAWFNSELAAGSLGNGFCSARVCWNRTRSSLSRNRLTS